MIFSNLNKQKNFFLIETSNQKITNRQFLKDIKKNKEKFTFKKRKTFFLLTENSYTFIILYYSLIEKKHPVFLINKNIKQDALKDLIKKYRPNYIIVPKSAPFSLKVKKYKDILDHTVFITSNIVHKLNNDLAVLLSTSGSTGSPKFVMLSKKNLTKNAQDICNYLNLKKTNITISNLPFNYSYGLSVLNSHVLACAKIVISNESILTKNFWKVFHQKKINTFYGVPQIYEILKKIKFSPRNINMKFMANAGGPITKENLDYIKKIAIKKNFNFFNMYGQTEASPRISYSSLKKKQQSIYSVGKPFGGAKIYIKDIDNNLCKTNKVGKIIYYGKNVMIGYANHYKDLNKKRINKYFLHTGDIGFKDKNQNLFLVGRNDAYVKISGIRVNLDDIDNLLKKKCDISSKSIAINNRIYIFSVNSFAISDILQILTSNFSLRKNDFKFIFINKFNYSLNGKIDIANLKNIANERL